MDIFLAFISGLFAFILIVGGREAIRKQEEKERKGNDLLEINQGRCRYTRLSRCSHTGYLLRYRHKRMFFVF